MDSAAGGGKSGTRGIPGPRGTFLHAPPTPHHHHVLARRADGIASIGVDSVLQFSLGQIESSSIAFFNQHFPGSAGITSEHWKLRGSVFSWGQPRPIGPFSASLHHRWRNIRHEFTKFPPSRDEARGFHMRLGNGQEIRTGAEERA